MHEKFVESVFLSLLLVALAASVAKADRATSTNFIIESGAVDVGGEESTSTNFQVPGTIGEPALDLSTSSNFRVIGGFLAFPFVTDPVLSASAGAEQVTLSWTASQGFLGFNVTSYDVGTGTASDAETFENVGSVLSFAKTGLTGGQTYFFKVRAKDEFGEVIAVSNEINASPTGGAAPAGPQVGGGATRETPRAIIAPAARKAIDACGDGNGAIDMKDFSIMLYFFGQKGPDLCHDFNGNGEVGMADVSILLYYWTG